MQNQYATVRNASKGEAVAQDDTDQVYGFVDEFLEEAIKSSSIYQSEQDAEHEYWTTDNYAYATSTSSVSNTSHNSCVELPILQDRYHISILDGGADTCVLGKGWKLLASKDSRRSNVFGFDHEDAVKRNLPIVSAITAVDLPDGSSIVLTVHEAIYNDTGNHALLSEFQLREFGVQIDSVCHRHGGTQQMVIQDDGESLVVPLELASCMIQFKHRLPNDEGVKSLKQYCLTRGESPWNPLAFSDQVVDKYHRKVLDEKQVNTNLNSKNVYTKYMS
jgi:hypothetical protein